MTKNGIKALARKFAIRNAVEYGKADEKAVLGKVVSNDQDARKDITGTSAIVKETVSEINKMHKKELEEAFAEFEKEFGEYDKARAEKTAKPNMELPGAKEGDFVTRFPPEPSGYMHIGHAKAVFLESEFARIYKGKVNLYFDDSNPENEKQEFVDAFKKDLEWLGIEFGREYYASDNIKALYKYAEEMIKKSGAYVCTCTPEKTKELRLKGQGCQHKLQRAEDNLLLWKKMLEGKFQKNEAVLRLNAIMEDENTAMRDPTLFRIKQHRHYRQGVKYTVWPTYDFNTPVMDSLYGVTDTIRSKEYELRDKSYYTILDRLKLRKPKIHSMARLEIVGNMTSKRKTNALIKEHKIKGYDDPRLVTIIALRRRGITPQAIKEFVLKSGMSKAESKVSIDTLIADNRKIIDKDAVRLFAVEDPILVEISNGKADAKLKLHPTKNAGFRNYSIYGEVYISKKDVGEDNEVRLKDLYDIRIISRSMNKIVAERIDGVKPTRTIQWVPMGNTTYCTLEYIGNLLDGEEFNKKSMSEVKVLAENHVSRLAEGDVIQFERIGYFKLDNKKEMRFFSL